MSEEELLAVLNRRVTSEPDNIELKLQAIRYHARHYGAEHFIKIADDIRVWNASTELHKKLCAEEVLRRLGAGWESAKKLAYFSSQWRRRWIVGESCRPVISFHHRIAQFIHMKTRMVFNLIPGGFGKFYSVGNWHTEDYPRKQVRPFLIADFPIGITQLHFLRGGDFPQESFMPELDIPAVYINWSDIDLTFESNGFQLPTRIQWEWACRAGTDSVFWWGEEFEPDRIWHNGNSGGPETKKTSLTAGGHRNSFGLYDMIGNVAEYCQDWWVEVPYPEARDQFHYPVMGGCYADHKESYIMNRPGYLINTRGESGSNKVGARAVKNIPGVQ